jgi:hypothetical protein
MPEAHRYNKIRYFCQSDGKCLIITVWTVRGSNPGGSEFFGTRSLSQGKSGRDVTLKTHPLLGPRLNKEYSYTSTSLWAFMAC